MTYSGATVLRARLCAAALLFLLTDAAFAAPDAPLQMTVTAKSIAVTNATPGGRVILFASGLDGRGGVLRQHRIAESVTVNATGVAEHTLLRPAPYRTIVVAVDVETGRTALAGPADYEVQLRRFPTELLEHHTDGVSGIAGVDVPRADLLVVRPKVGAWRLLASEGGGGDVDEKFDGRLQLDFSAARPVGADTAAPKRLKSKDVVVLIDSARLEVFTTEIGQ